MSKVNDQAIMQSNADLMQQLQPVDSLQSYNDSLIKELELSQRKLQVPAPPTICLHRHGRERVREEGERGEGGNAAGRGAG